MTAAVTSASGFFAAHDLGSHLRLQLPVNRSVPGPTCAAEAAVALAGVEPLLAALDAWFDDAGLAAPTWAWGALADDPAPALAWAHTDDGAALGLPWPLLRRLGPPPVPVTWAADPAAALLAQPRLGEADIAALAPGALLVLAPSFEPGWAPAWRARAELDALPGWQLRSAAPAAWTVPALCGWAEAPDPAPPVDEAELCRDGRAVARGRLLPWGRGCGLLIDTVHP